jgi:hypothetical protein
MKSIIKNLSFYSILLVLYLLNSLSGEFIDEWDNILGGKLIKEGILPYKGFFSHHAPLTYFISFFINVFSGTNFVLFRILFGVFLFSWSVLLFQYIKKEDNENFLRYFLILLALVSIITGMQMLLAETLVGYALLSTFLIVYYKYEQITLKDLSLISLFGFIIFSTSFGHLFLVITIYLLILLLLLKNKYLLSFSKVTALIFIILTPYLFFTGYLLLTNSFFEFYWQNIIFNKKYYLGFLKEVPTNFFFLFFYIVKNFIQSYWYLITHFNNDNFFYIGLFVFDSAFMMYLLKNKNNVLAFLSFLLILFSTSRFDISQNIAHHGNISFYPLSVFFFSFISFELYSYFHKNYSEFKKDYYAFAGTIIGLISLAFIATKSLSIYYDIITYEIGKKNCTCGQNFVSKKIDELVRDNEYYWIGPFNFKEIYFTNKKLATKYTFYLPWLAESQEIRNQIIHDFESNKPVIIVFNTEMNIWGYSAADYGRDIITYLKNNYFQIDDSSYKYFYFLKTKDKELLDRIKEYKGRITCDTFDTLPKDIEKPLVVNYSNKVNLLGITINKLCQHQIQISLFWRYIDNLGPYNAAFIHFTDIDNKILFQNDHDFCERRPFVEIKGKFIKETFIVNIPRSANGKKFDVKIGIYGPEITTNGRLKIDSAGGTSMDDGNTRAIVEKISL